MTSRLREPTGELALRYTVPARLMQAPPPHLTPLMETPFEDGILVGLSLDPSYRVRFVRTGFGVPVLQARVDAVGCMQHKHWLIRLVWDWEDLRISVEVEPV